MSLYWYNQINFLQEVFAGIVENNSLLVFINGLFFVSPRAGLKPGEGKRSLLIKYNLN